MSWAAQRRFIILLIVSAIVVAFCTVVLIATFYKTPTCSDDIQNQGEQGIDCGGPCPYLCAALEQPPTVLFTKVLSNGAGRTDIIASVQNKNANAAAKNVPYRIALYGSNLSLIQEIDGTLDLPPGATEPVYLPGVAPGKRVVSAFLTIAASAPQWFAMVVDPRIIPVVVSATQTGTRNAPRIEAVLANLSAGALFNVQVIAFVHDIHTDIIAASETMVQTIPAQGQAVAIFTWNSAFASTPSLMEIMPVISLPAQTGLP